MPLQANQTEEGKVFEKVNAGTATLADVKLIIAEEAKKEQANAYGLNANKPKPFTETLNNMEKIVKDDKTAQEIAKQA